MVASLRPVSYILKTSVTLSSSSFESCWVAGLLLALLPAGSCFGDLEDIVVGLNRKHTKPNAHETVHCYNQSCPKSTDPIPDPYRATFLRNGTGPQYISRLQERNGIEMGIL